MELISSEIIWKCHIISSRNHFEVKIYSEIIWDTWYVLGWSPFQNLSWWCHPTSNSEWRPVFSFSRHLEPTSQQLHQPSLSLCQHRQPTRFSKKYINITSEINQLENHVHKSNFKKNAHCSLLQNWCTFSTDLTLRPLAFGETVWHECTLTTSETLPSGDLNIGKP